MLKLFLVLSALASADMSSPFSAFAFISTASPNCEHFKQIQPFKNKLVGKISPVSSYRSNNLVPT
jgi:hypothetical protein